MADYSVAVKLQIAQRGLENIQALLGELDKSGAATNEFRQRAHELGRELERLSAEQRLVEQFRRQKSAVKEAADEMKRAQQEAQKLGREMAASENPTKRQVAEFDRARTAARNAGQAYQQQQVSLQQLRQQMSGAGIDTGNLAAAQARIRSEADAARSAQGRLTAELRGSQQAAAGMGGAAQKAGEQARQSFAGAAGEAQRFSGSLSGVGTALHSAFAAAGLGVTVRELAGVADAVSNVVARLKLVEGSGEAARAAFDRVLEVAQRTNSNLEATALLYGRLAQAGREIGLGNKDALALTETILQAIQVSGASAQESEAAVRQLIQGLQAGVVRGQDLNSVLSMSPRLAKAMADGLGVPIGALRELGEQGKLTTAEVVRALQGQRGAIEREFGELPDTVGRAAQRLQNAWAAAIGELDRTQGYSAKAVAAIQTLTANVGTLVTVAETAGNAVVVYLGVKALSALLKFAAEGGKALAGLRAHIDDTVKQFGVLGKAVLLLQSAFVGWQVGSWLNNFAVVRQAGVVMVRGLIEAIELGRLSWESFAALFTSDTIDKAIARYQQRIGQARAVLRDQFAAAGQDVQPAVNAIEAVGQKADEQKPKISALAKEFPLLAQAITPVGAAGQQAAQGVSSIGAAAADAGRELDKLSVAQLAKLRTEAERAFATGKINAQQFTLAIDQVGAGIERALGVSFARHSARITKGFEENLDALGVFIRSLDELKARGLDTGKALQDTFVAAAAKASNRAEIDALIRRVEELGKVGELSAQQVAAAMVVLRQRTEELTPGVQSAEEAYRALGITSQAELRKAAAASAEAFTVLRQARVPLQDLQAAFDAYAASQIAAYGETRKQALEIQAHTLGLTAAWNKAAGAAADAAASGGDAARSTANALDGVGRAADGAADKVARIPDELARGAEKAAELKRQLAELRVDAQGFSVDTGGQRVNAAGRTEEQARMQMAAIIRGAFGAAALDNQAAQQFARNTLRINDYLASIEAGLHSSGVRGGQMDKGLSDLLLQLRADNAALASQVSREINTARATEPAGAAATTQPRQTATLPQQTIRLVFEAGSLRADAFVDDEAMVRRVIDVLAAAGARVYRGN